MKKHVYVGYDPREVRAYRTCIASLRKYSADFSVEPVNSRLAGSALYYRPETLRDGVLWDEVSQAPMSTEFSLARFLVPLIHREGAALYVDCDFLFRCDIEELFALFDPRYSVQCVQHASEQADQMIVGKKMDGQLQTCYPRKNWSSLMLFNCSRIAKGASLTVKDVNALPGHFLHRFEWLHRDEVGALPVEWNYLVGVSPYVASPKAVHFTLGTPDLPGYEGCEYADEWRALCGPAS